MIHLEQELIKRHNIKMMNEMQEVVRQIKQAKTKNDEILRDYHKKQTDLTRSVLEIAEKFATMRGELDEIKRQAIINKQQLTHRCDQNTDQVAQLKHAVFSAWQKEKAEIQQKVSQNYRGDLALVLGQFDAKLRENFADTSKLRYEVKRLTARMNGEDPDSVAYEMPSYTDTAVAAVNKLPAVDSSSGIPVGSGSSDDAPATSGPPPGLSGTPPASSGSPAGGVNLASLTQNLAAFIARQQAASGGGSPGAPPQVNVQMLQQFMQTLPRQQQLQLQMLLQQHRAQQQQQTTGVSPQAPTQVSAPAQASGQTQAPAQAVAATPPGLTSPQAAAPQPAASMIQSLAQQLQLQVNTAQQKASTMGPGTVNCPYFSMFGWCKFGERCRYIHNATGKEPLRNLPQSVIQTLQNQLASGSTELTTQTLMTALAGVAARQQQGGAPATTASPPAAAPSTNTSAPPNNVQQAMIQAQIQAQQEAAQMGPARAKQLPCRFFAIGRCAYGDRCGYNHALTTAGATSAGPDTSSQVAAAAAAAWGKTGLQTASWGVGGGLGGASSATDEAGQNSDENGGTGLIMDGEDDTSYDQWNAMTFEGGDDNNAASMPPPGL